MTLEVVIPTLNRPQSLKRALDSVQNSLLLPDFRVSYETEPRPLPVVVNELVSSSRADVVLIGSDDMELFPGTLSRVMEVFETVYPDLDGVVGLFQVNVPPVLDCTEFAFTALGSRFLERFPGRCPFCPHYYHFYGDTELGLYAKSVKRFTFCPEARVVHHHPSHSNTPADFTHFAARTRIKEDQALFRKRQACGLLWGESIEKEVS